MLGLPMLAGLIGKGAAAGWGATKGLTGLAGLLAKMKAMGIDPTMLGLGALYAFGGEDAQKRQSFAVEDPSQGQARLTDPRNALYQALQGTYRLGQGLTERGPVSLRSATTPAPRSPISIPGIPFQFGAGAGRDPALDDPSLLGYDLSDIFKYDPFQSLGKWENPPKDAWRDNPDTDREETEQFGKTRPSVRRRAPRAGTMV